VGATCSLSSLLMGGRNQTALSASAKDSRGRTRHMLPVCMGDLPDTGSLREPHGLIGGAVVVRNLCLSLLAFYRRDPIPSCNVGTTSFTGCFSERCSTRRVKPCTNNHPQSGGYLPCPGVVQWKPSGSLSGALVSRKAVSWVRVDVWAQLVRRHFPSPRAAIGEDHIRRNSATASPVDEALNRNSELFCESLGATGLLNFFVECVHATKSKRCV